MLAAAGVLASAETDVTVGGKSFIILSEFWPRYEVTVSRGTMWVWNRYWRRRRSQNLALPNRVAFPSHLLFIFPTGSIVSLFPNKHIRASERKSPHPGMNPIKRQTCTCGVCTLVWWQLANIHACQPDSLITATVVSLASALLVTSKMQHAINSQWVMGS